MPNLNSVISYFDKWVSPSISDDPDLKLGRSTSELSQTVDRREGYTPLSPSTSYLSIPFSLFIAIRLFHYYGFKSFHSRLRFSSLKKLPWIYELSVFIRCSFRWSTYLISYWTFESFELIYSTHICLVWGIIFDCFYFHPFLHWNRKACK